MARDRMSTVLRVRALHEQRALTAMGAAAGAVVTAQAIRDGAVASMRDHRLVVTDVSLLRLARTVGTGLTESVERAEAGLAGAHAAHTRAVEVWRARRAELLAVERLVDRRAAVARLEEQRVEQHQMDELAILTRTQGAA
jgi:hypothetical protein